MIYYDDDVLKEEIPRSLYNIIILFEKYFPRIRSIPTNNNYYYDKKKKIMLYYCDVMLLLL